MSVIYKNIICCPDCFYDSEIQNAIQQSCCALENQWIYNINEAHDETVLHDECDFVICTDRPDEEMKTILVIFKDTDLKTIRDLRAKHIPILFRARDMALRLSSQKNPATIQSVYFNYMPSVFQLHMHISEVVSSTCHVRAHRFNEVIRNLRKRDLYYKEALILTRIQRNHCLFLHYKLSLFQQKSNRESNSNALNASTNFDQTYLVSDACHQKIPSKIVRSQNIC